VRRVATVLALGLVLGLAAREASRSDPPDPRPPGPASDAARFGASAVHAERYDLSRAGAAWYLNWTPFPAPGTDLEFVPMVCAYPDGDPVTTESLAALREKIEARRDEYPPGTLWLVGNELGYPPQRDSRSPERYAIDFQACRTMLLGVDPSFRVAVGPVILSQRDDVVQAHVGGLGGLGHLAAVMKSYREQYGEAIPADFFSATAHVLEGEGMDSAVFEEQIVALRRLLAENGMKERGLVVTEFGVAIGDPEDEEVERFLESSVRFLAEARDPEIGCRRDDFRLVQRFAWFTAHRLGWLEELRLLGFGAFAVDLKQTALLRRNGDPSGLGRAYARAAREYAGEAAAPSTPGRTDVDERIRQALEEASTWLEIEGVESVGRGEEDGRPVLVVGVSVPPEAVRERIPALLRGFPVVVRFVGVMTAE
jgi:hypothetical protein